MTSQNPEELRADIERTRSDLSRNVNALGEAVTPGNIARRQADKAAGFATGVKNKVMGSAEDAASGLSDRASAVGDRASDAPQAVRRQTQGNPLAAGLVALGAGWLLGSLLPASEKERELAAAARDNVEPMLQEGKDAVRAAAENLKEPAQEALDAVKQSAQDSADTVKDAARSTTAEVKDSAQESADVVREHQQRPDTSL